MLRKRSFFERLTGAVNVDYEDEADDVAVDLRGQQAEDGAYADTEDTLLSEADDALQAAVPSPAWAAVREPEDSGAGELLVDVYQTADDIIIKAMVAGVKPEDLDITITRDMVVIKGKRDDVRAVAEEDYFQRELHWGTLSRTVLLPQEVEVEEAEAMERHGLLVVKLPKVDKQKQTRLKVRSA